MTVSLTTWCYYMDQANPISALARKDGHQWICAGPKGEKANCTLISHDLFWQSVKKYKKYSLKKIADISINILEEKACRIQNNMHLIDRILDQKKSLYDTMSKEAAIACLDKIGKFYSKTVTHLERITEVIDNMSQRAQEKHKIGKSQGIWSRIQNLIWNYFYNPNRKIAHCKRIIEKLIERDDPTESYVRAIYHIKIHVHEALCQENATDQDKDLYRKKKDTLDGMLNVLANYVSNEKMIKYNLDYYKAVQMEMQSEVA